MALDSHGVKLTGYGRPLSNLRKLRRSLTGRLRKGLGVWDVTTRHSIKCVCQNEPKCKDFELVSVHFPDIQIEIVDIAVRCHAFQRAC